jgi:hypothetical protein
VNLRKEKPMVGAGVTLRILKNAPAALKWSEEIASYIRDKHGLELECWSRIGATREVIWFARHPDLSSVEKFREALFADQAYWQKVKKAETEGFFDMTSFEEMLFQKLA